MAWLGWLSARGVERGQRREGEELEGNEGGRARRGKGWLVVPGGREGAEKKRRRAGEGGEGRAGLGKG